MPSKHVQPANWPHPSLSFGPAYSYTKKSIDESLGNLIMSIVPEGEKYAEQISSGVRGLITITLSQLYPSERKDYLIDVSALLRNYQKQMPNAGTIRADLFESFEKLADELESYPIS